ncbi:MAG: hypothetical protein RL603_1059 [Pseudomonadota bacterium]
MTQGLRHTLTLVIGIALGAGAAVAWLNATPPAPAAKVASVAAPSRAAAPAPAAPSGLTAQDQQRLTEILQRVRREYVDEVPRERLLDDAARGMVSSLDAYSAYLDQREYEEIRRGAAGNYPGIGIEVAAEGKAIKVLRPLSDSPAERAGLRSGDEIVRIDDAPVGRDVEEAIEQMRGPAGSRVRLTVRRAGSGELVDVSLERTRVEVHSVSGQMLAANRAYVRIVAFSDTTLADLETVLKSLRQTHQIAGLVLDLRNNPGGVLEAAVAVADAMLDGGNIVSAEGRTPDARFRMDAKPGQLLSGVDVVVLVNGASASAAEILAGALKDNHRARLVGRRTYGKGLVQSVIPLSDGRALKITTSRYATPSGAMINERGIQPDVVLKGPETAPGDPLRDIEVKAALREFPRVATPRRHTASTTKAPRA